MYLVDTGSGKKFFKKSEWNKRSPGREQCNKITSATLENGKLGTYKIQEDGNRKQESNQEKETQDGKKLEDLKSEQKQNDNFPPMHGLSIASPFQQTGLGPLLVDVFPVYLARAYFWNRDLLPSVLGTWHMLHTQQIFQTDSL